MLKQIAQTAIWLAIFAVAFGGIERLFTLRALGTRREGIARDLGYFFLNSLAPGLLLGTVAALLVRASTHLLPGPYVTWLVAQPFWTRAIAFFVAGEIGYYWGHRLCHANRFLWRFHAVHHSAEHIDWLTNTRAHPFDLIFGQICALAPGYMLGLATPSPNMHGATPLALIVVARVWSFFIHANVKWRFGPLEWLISTPAFHHWHHTNDANRDRNFASNLPWLDALFGTLHLPRREWPSEYGIDDKSMPKDAAGQILRPLGL